MKRIIGRVLSIAVFALLLFQLTSCSQSYSSDTLKSGLEKAGYTVKVNPVIDNLETSKMDGYKSSLYGYKTVNGEEDGILILIFNDSKSADKVGNPEGGVATDTVSMLNDWGRKHAPEADLSVYGISNNIVWAGSSQAKDAAGIK